jgi:hypothetical protein
LRNNTRQIKSNSTKIVPFLAFGFLAHYAGLVGSYFAITRGGQFAPEKGYNSFELALAFGPLISLIFMFFLLGALCSRIRQLSAATWSRQLAGAGLAACLALIVELAIDLRIARFIDKYVMPPWLGDWLIPALAAFLVFAACYVGVRLAASAPTPMARAL